MDSGKKSFTGTVDRTSPFFCLRPILSSQFNTLTVRGIPPVNERIVKEELQNVPRV